jgi:regulator of replication initiation timing
MRNPLLPLVRVLSFATLFLALPAHAQWAVVDVFAQVQWPTQIRTMIDQYNTLRAQYETLKQQVTEVMRINQELTGVTGRSALANSLLEQAERRWLPTSWQDVVSLQKAGLNPGRYGDWLKWYEDRLKTIDATLIVPGTPDHRANWSYQLSSENTRAAFASAQALFDQLDKRLRNVETLNQGIEQADSLKQAVDLNSRMLAEQSFLSIELARLKSVQLMLQASAQNGTNSGTATRAEFLGTN